MNNKNNMILTLFALVTMFAHLMTPVKVEGFAKGNGTEKNPYQIENVKQLNMIREYPDQYFVLIKDIDLSGINNFKPIGDEDAPFEGFFNGNKKTIKNLKINRPKEDNVGLFGVIHIDAVVKNIKLENVDVTGKDKVGGVVGSFFIKEEKKENTKEEGIGFGIGKIVDLFMSVKRSININYVSVYGKVKGEKSVGGIAGLVKNIKNSYGNVSVIGMKNVGGLVGFSLSIENSYTMGNVTGKELVGGLTGVSLNIKNSYTTGHIKGQKYVGGLIGLIPFGYISNCYSISNVKGNIETGGFIGYMGYKKAIKDFRNDNNNFKDNSKDGGMSKFSEKIAEDIMSFIITFLKNKMISSLEGKTGKNYWVVGSSAEGIGFKDNGYTDNFDVIKKTKAQLKNLTIRSAGWDKDIWVFEKGKYPRLFWEK